jgi:hypothetical protein
MIFFIEKILKCNYNYGKCLSDDEGELVPSKEEVSIFAK